VPAAVAIGVAVAVAVAVGVVDAAGVAVAVAVAVGPAVCVAVAVAVGVGVVSPVTTTVPVMNSCAPHTNAYVPGLSNVQADCQPGPEGKSGSAGVHRGDWPPANTTLWKLRPSG
jgi:hypothetical protein